MVIVLALEERYIYSDQFSEIKFGGNFVTPCIAGKNNIAVLSHDNSNIIFNGVTTVSSNIIACNGGGSRHACPISNYENSTVIFNSNTATLCGSAVYCNEHSGVSFDGSILVTFTNNSAEAGGTLYCNDNSHVSCTGNSTVRFTNNRATDGGAICADKGSFLVFDYTSSVFLCNN